MGRPRGTPKTGGRQKGTPNKVTQEAREAARLIVEDPVYRANLAERAKAGDLSPAVECMLWHYAHGKPVERVEHADANGNPLGMGLIVKFVDPDPQDDNGGEGQEH